MKHPYFLRLPNILTLLLAIFLFSPSLAWSEYKIATIDMTRILNEIPESVAAKKQLDKETASVKKQIEKDRASLKRKEEKLRGNKNSDASDVEAFRKEAREFGRTVKDSEEDLRRKFAKLNSKLTEKTLTVVTRYAKSENIDIVLDKGATGRGPVLFGTPHVDITEQVLKELKG